MIIRGPDETEMRIIFEPEVAVKVLSMALKTGNEFSGFGFIERREDGNIHVYDFVLLADGSWGYTEIDPQRIIALMDRPDFKNMKLWLHRHPCGDGIPGEHNWSGTDKNTRLREPMGSTPADVKWSVSVVITPKGWVGVLDNYVKGISQHLHVLPAMRTHMEELAALEQHRFQARQMAGGTAERFDQEAPEGLTEEQWDELLEEVNQTGHTFDLQCPICGGRCEYLDDEKLEEIYDKSQRVELLPEPTVGFANCRLLPGFGFYTRYGNPIETTVCRSGSGSEQQ